MPGRTPAPCRSRALEFAIGPAGSKVDSTFTPPDSCCQSRVDLRFSSAPRVDRPRLLVLILQRINTRRKADLLAPIRLGVRDYSISGESMGEGGATCQQTVTTKGIALEKESSTTWDTRIFPLPLGAWRGQNCSSGAFDLDYVEGANMAGPSGRFVVIQNHAGLGIMAPLCGDSASQQ